MQLSTKRVQFLWWETEVKERVLVLAVAHAQSIMNEKPDDSDTAKLQAKAVELLNNPDQFKDRLFVSVVALMGEDDLDEGVDDEVLVELIDDAFDALAGVNGSD